MEPWLLWLIFISLGLLAVGFAGLAMKIVELEDEMMRIKSFFLHELNEHEKGFHGVSE